MVVSESLSKVGVACSGFQHKPRRENNLADLEAKAKKQPEDLGKKQCPQ